MLVLAMVVNGRINIYINVYGSYGSWVWCNNNNNNNYRCVGKNVNMKTFKKKNVMFLEFQ